MVYIEMVRFYGLWVNSMHSNGLQIEYKEDFLEKFFFPKDKRFIHSSDKNGSHVQRFNL